jgi:hypothetical protein
MSSKKFGNWLVTTDGIEWNGTPKIEYLIDGDRLAETADIGGVTVYDWPFHMVNKTWLSREDIQDLNEAFQFACKQFNVVLSDSIWEDTLKIQAKDLRTK